MWNLRGGYQRFVLPKVRKEHNIQILKELASKSDKNILEKNRILMKVPALQALLTPIFKPNAIAMLRKLEKPYLPSYGEFLKFHP